MTDSNGIWFVYRSHYDGPLSKRVRRLDAPSIVAWFGRKLDQARTSDEPGHVADEELGGSVYGLASLFEAAKKQQLAPPKTTAALKTLLEDHLYVEGDVRLDAHSLRAKTDDDEVDLAYYFLDDVAVANHADRLAYLLHDKPGLPEGIAQVPAARFEPPVEVRTIGPAGDGKGTTYACLFTFYDSESMPGSVRAFEGVRLPTLAAHLRRVVPESRPSSWSPEYLDTWPVELRLLRAMIVAEDATIERALQKCGAYPLTEVASHNTSRLGVGEWSAALSEFETAASAMKSGGDPGKSIVQARVHAALLCAHTTHSFGYQQWILFDDQWAAANADLASSILRYASGWDPFSDGDEDEDD